MATSRPRRAASRRARANMTGASVKDTEVPVATAVSAQGRQGRVGTRSRPSSPVPAPSEQENKEAAPVVPQSTRRTRSRVASPASSEDDARAEDVAPTRRSKRIRKSTRLLQSKKTKSVNAATAATTVSRDNGDGGETLNEDTKPRSLPTQKLLSAATEKEITVLTRQRARGSEKGEEPSTTPEGKPPPNRKRKRKETTKEEKEYDEEEASSEESSKKKQETNALDKDGTGNAEQERMVSSKRPTNEVKSDAPKIVAVQEEQGTARTIGRIRAMVREKQGITTNLSQPQPKRKLRDNVRPSRSSRETENDDKPEAMLVMNSSGSRNDFGLGKDSSSTSVKEKALEVMKAIDVIDKDIDKHSKGKAPEVEAAARLNSPGLHREYDDKVVSSLQNLSGNEESNTETNMSEILAKAESGTTDRCSTDENKFQDPIGSNYGNDEIKIFGTKAKTESGQTQIAEDSSDENKLLNPSGNEESNDVTEMSRTKSKSESGQIEKDGGNTDENELQDPSGNEKSDNEAKTNTKSESGLTEKNGGNIDKSTLQDLSRNKERNDKGGRKEISESGQTKKDEGSTEVNRLQDPSGNIESNNEAKMRGKTAKSEYEKDGGSVDENKARCDNGEERSPPPPEGKTTMSQPDGRPSVVATDINEPSAVTTESRKDEVKVTTTGSFHNDTERNSSDQGIAELPYPASNEGSEQMPDGLSGHDDERIEMDRTQNIDKKGQVSSSPSRVAPIKRRIEINIEKALGEPAILKRQKESSDTHEIGSNGPEPLNDVATEPSESTPILVTDDDKVLVASPEAGGLSESGDVGDIAVEANPVVRPIENDSKALNAIDARIKTEEAANADSDQESSTATKTSLPQSKSPNGVWERGSKQPTFQQSYTSPNNQNQTVPTSLKFESKDAAEPTRVRADSSRTDTTANSSTTDETLSPTGQHLVSTRISEPGPPSKYGAIPPSDLKPSKHPPVVVAAPSVSEPNSSDIISRTKKQEGLPEAENGGCGTHQPENKPLAAPSAKETLSNLILDTKDVVETLHSSASAATNEPETVPTNRKVSKPILANVGLSMSFPLQAERSNPQSMVPESPKSVENNGPLPSGSQLKNEVLLVVNGEESLQSRNAEIASTEAKQAASVPHAYKTPDEEEGQSLLREKLNQTPVDGAKVTNSSLESKNGDGGVGGIRGGLTSNVGERSLVLSDESPLSRRLSKKQMILHSVELGRRETVESHDLVETVKADSSVSKEELIDSQGNHPKGTQTAHRMVAKPDDTMISVSVDYSGNEFSASQGQQGLISGEDGSSEKSNDTATVDDRFEIPFSRLNQPDAKGIQTRELSTSSQPNTDSGALVQKEVEKTERIEGRQEGVSLMSCAQHQQSFVEATKELSPVRTEVTQDSKAELDENGGHRKQTEKVISLSLGNRSQIVLMNREAGTPPVGIHMNDDVKKVSSSPSPEVSESVINMATAESDSTGKAEGKPETKKEPTEAKLDSDRCETLYSRGELHVVESFGRAFEREMESAPLVFQASESETPATGMKAPDEARNLRKLKLALYSAGLKAHRGKLFHKLFACYWSSLGQYIQGNRTRRGTSESRWLVATRKKIDLFLTTRRLRKLHNSILLALLEKCGQADYPADKGGAFSRIIMSDEEGSTRIGWGEGLDFDVRSDVWSAAVVDSPAMWSEAKTLALSERRFHRPSKTSEPVLGALGIDPVVRSIVSDGGAKCSEQAIWLLVVGVKHYVRSLLKKAIQNSEEIRKGEALVSRHQTFQSAHERKPESSKKERQGKHPPGSLVTATRTKMFSSPKKFITALDIASTFMGKTTTSSTSLGGAESRFAYERCVQASQVNAYATYPERFHVVEGLVAKNISKERDNHQDTDAGLAFSPPKKAIETSKARERHAIATPKSNNRTQGTAAVPRKEEKQLTQAFQVQESRKSPPAGLGRGAKDLAALKMRSTTGSNDGVTMDEETKNALPVERKLEMGTEKSQQAQPKKKPAATRAAAVPSPNSTIAAKESHSSSGPNAGNPMSPRPSLPTNLKLPDNPPMPVKQQLALLPPPAIPSRQAATPPGGRGFGVKNLAAMRQRSSTTTTTSGEAQENDNNICATTQSEPRKSSS